MPVTYKNRLGQVWNLFQGKTKLGKPRYFLSQALTAATGTPVPSMPEGYEIYEKPTGQVFCRKHQPVLVTDDEVQVVKKELAKHRLSACIVERKAAGLIIHEPQGMDGDSIARLYGVDPHVLAGFALKSRHYQPIFLFQLTDDDRRLFSASRWCFNGSIDGWSSLDGNRPLTELAMKYLKHIGQESFHELF